MTNKLFKLKFSNSLFKTNSSWPEINVEKILSILKPKNLDVFEIDFWGLINVELFIEDDLLFLAEDANYIKSNHSKHEHNIFLGDGEVVINTKIEKDVVKITLEYCPFLNKIFLKTYKLELPYQNYKSMWCEVAVAINSQLKT